MILQPQVLSAISKSVLPKFVSVIAQGYDDYNEDDDRQFDGYEVLNSSSDIFFTIMFTSAITAATTTWKGTEKSTR